MLDLSVRRQVMLFGQGGRAVLEAIRRQKFDTLSRRPVISGWRQGRLIAQALAKRAGGQIQPEVCLMTVPDSKEQVLYAGPMNLGLEQSRAYCEHLTRTQARNFYYGLKLLPDAKRAAMFAIYAYMRLVV